MKILILTFGTRGDIEPFISLGLRLAVAGHRAELAVPRRFASDVAAAGLTAHGIADGPLADSDSLSKAIGDVSEGGLLTKFKLATSLPKAYADVLRNSWTIAESVHPDLIVHNGQVLAGVSVAEKLNVPAVLALLAPLYVPTTKHVWPGSAMPHNLPGWLNRASFVGMKAPMLSFGRTLDKWRDDLSLPRRRHRHDPLKTPTGERAPVLHAVSPQVLPRPDDWPSEAETTGYWFRGGEPRALGPEVEAFLNAGEAPIYLGFGSMAGADPDALTKRCLEAIESAGVRAIAATGWGGVRRQLSSDRILFIDDVSHAALFPRVSAVIHHGGAGTTAAAANSGQPQVICPFVADQFFWSHRMHSLHVATAPISQRRLDPSLLSHQIERAVSDPRMADSATALGERIRNEDGTGAAVASLERIATDWMGQL